MKEYKEYIEITRDHLKSKMPNLSAENINFLMMLFLNENCIEYNTPAEASNYAAECTMAMIS